VKANNPTLDINPELARGIGGELAATVEQLADRLALSTAVTDRPSLEQAVSDRVQLGERVKAVQDFFRPFKSAAHALHKALCDRENAILAPLLRLDRAKQTAIAVFHAAETTRRRLEEQRIADERKREADAAALREAAALERLGDHALAAAVVAEAVARPAPVVALPDTVREVANFRRTWHWRLTTEALVPREFLCVDTKKLDKYATAMQASAKVAGVEFYSTDTPVR
jgi:hypothetical protein